MDFHPSERALHFARQIRSFVDDHLIPAEKRATSFDAHGNIAAAPLAEFRSLARSRNLWCLQMPVASGGQGLSLREMAVCYEEMNRSIFGPVVFNSAAPDDGNMMLLEKVGTPAQKARWLQPIVDGKVRSAFAMTEPMPGGGSDPSMIRTRAERRGDRWVVHGQKWFITGAEDAQHFILVARTSDDSRKGLTAFLFDRGDPGWEIVRRIGIMGPEEHGGHCELSFFGLEIPDENRLLGVGDGLKVTQIRLGPARLTHCMRWSGLARRSLEIAADYVKRRRSGEHLLAEREGVQGMLGQAATQVDVGRLLTMKAAAALDGGSFARKEISMAKVAVSEALHHAVDTAIQLNGARGYSTDTPLEWIYRYARQARLVDGASEVHRMVIARELLTQGPDFFAWPGMEAERQTGGAHHA
jgi:acyl-CoA dehydrogenase